MNTIYSPKDIEVGKLYEDDDGNVHLGCGVFNTERNRNKEEPRFAEKFLVTLECDDPHDMGLMVQNEGANAKFWWKKGFTLVEG